MRGPTWSWDGSLEALLILTETARSERRAPDALEGEVGGDLFQGLTSPELAVAAPDEESANAALEALRASAPRLCAAAYRAWMAEEGVELDLLRVAAAYGSRGEGVLAEYGDPSLSRLAASVRRVNKEVHLLEGFARFSLRADGLWTAVLEPDHNVLPALAAFFVGRFGAEDYGLCDLKRGYGVVARSEGPGRASFRAVEGPGLEALLPDGSDREDAILWRSYVEVVENRSRRNPRLQRGLMPVRYWRHLTEFGAP